MLFSSRQLYIKDKYYQLCNDQHIAAISRTSNDIILKPYSTCFVKAKIKQNPYIEGNCKDIIFEPSKKGRIADYPFITAVPALNNLERGQFMVEMVNVSNATVTFPRNTILGHVEKHDRAQKVTNTYSDAANERTVNEITSIKTISDSDFLKLANIDNKHKIPITNFVLKNKNVFALSEKDLLTTDLAECDIDTGNHPPVNIRQYRIPLNCRDIVTETVNNLLEAKIIKKSNSKYNVPLIVVNKKSDDPSKPPKARVVCDLRSLNRITSAVPQNLERIEDIITRLKGSKFFTTLDLRSGFYQIPLTERASEKCSFSTPNGRYSFLKMPFGYVNSPSVFTEMMTKLLDGIESFATAYVDDILIHSGKDINDHLNKIQIVIDRLMKHNLRLKIEKCQWAQDEINYLGFHINQHGITPQADKVKAIKHMTAPKTVKQVRSFLGLMSFYRMFIPKFSELAQPLTELTRKYARFSWNDDCQKSFILLKEHLSSAPLLAYPDPSLPYHLWVDSSSIQVGAILCQMRINDKGEEVEMPIYFLSHKLSKSQIRSYSVTEKELFAIHYSIQKLDYYLRNATFEIRTDHMPLKHIFDSPNSSNLRCQRWMLTIAGYGGATMKYVRGDSQKSDVMSRMGVNNDSTSSGYEDAGLELAFPIEAVIDSGKIDTEAGLKVTDDALQQVEPDVHIPDELDMLEEQQQDENIRKIMRSIETNASDKFVANHFVIMNDLLYYIESPDNRAHLRLYIPEHLTQLVLKIYHDNGHPATRRLYNTIRTKYYWPNLYKHALKKVESCVICKQRNINQKRVPIADRDIPLGPNIVTQVDYIGPLTVTYSGNRYICSFIDTYTGWPEAFPLKDKTAESVIECLLEYYIPRHSCMRILVSDCGGEFKNGKLDSVLKELKIKHVFTSPYTPTSNAVAERSHKTLMDILAKMTKGDEQSWDLHLNQCLYAMRCNVNESTGVSPFMALYSRPACLALESLLTPRVKDYSEDFHKSVLQNMHHAFIETAKHAKKAMSNRNKQFNKNLKPVDLEIGHHVMRRNYTPTSKLSMKWLPNFIITDKNGHNSFVIKNLVTGKESRAHAMHLKRTNLQWKVPQAPNVRKSRLVASAPSTTEEDSDTSSEAEVPHRNIPRQIRSKMLERSDTESDEPINEFQMRKMLRNKDTTTNDPYNMSESTMSYEN